MAPGGVAVVVFWPPGSAVETQGPWAHWGAVLGRKLGDTAKSEDAAWEGALPAATAAAGGEVLEYRTIAHTIEWDSPAQMWEAMTRSGPWHALRLRRGDAFVDGLRDEWCAAFATDRPVIHTPRARLMVVRRKGPGTDLTVDPAI